MDTLRIVWMMNLVALGFLLLTAVVLAWNNQQSQNVVLATGALLGAAVLYVLPLVLELRTIHEHHIIAAEVTIDRAKPSIGRPQYAKSSAGMWRANAEVGASNWLAANDAGSFRTDPRKVTKDLILFSLLARLITTFDWQLDPTTYAGSSMMLTYVGRVSPVGQCTVFTKEDFRSLLKGANNIFAGAAPEVLRNELCLPPKTKLVLTQDKLEIGNPFCQIVFALEWHPRWITDAKPGTREEAPTLPDGNPRYETSLSGIQMDVTFDWLRAHHRQMPKYQEWATRLTTETRNWFEDFRAPH